MLKDIPYSTLKQNKREYEILLLRDLYGNTYTAIAKELEISTARVIELYHRIKRKQTSLYINRIALILGHSNTLEVRKIYNAAYEFYCDCSYAVAYLERKYKDILTEYRGGEPGMPMEFLKKLPPFKARLTKKQIARVIEMRETEKATFVVIAKEMHLTPEKAKRIYDFFYHQKVLKLVETLQARAESQEEEYAIWKQYFRGHKSPKKCYDMLIERVQARGK